MKVGLLSDTHGYLDPKILEHFRDCDEVWHAGDIGDVSITDALQKFKSRRAVFGNIDSKEIRNQFPEDLWFDCEGLKIWITHIAGIPPNYNPRIKKILKDQAPAVLICGHSHILKVQKDEKNNLLFINPGAAGQQGFHAMRTIIRMEIVSGVVQKMEVIELGKRGQL